MSCCGQSRARVAAAAPTKTATAVPAAKAALVKPVAPKSIAAAAAPSGPTMKLHYTGVAPVRVRGPQTGRTYVFSGAAPIGAVDRRDAEGLMRIGLFRRAV
jgi:hypothetical protein